MSRHDVAMRRVLYQIPGMQSVPVRDASFTGADGDPLPMRIYGETGPAVVLLEGYPDAGFQQHVGCRFMEMEWTISMAQLIGASGMIAVTHSNRAPQPDAKALIDSLRTDNARVGIWSTSGHAPVALRMLPQVDAAVLSNPLLQAATWSSEANLPPLFVIRSGRDETPGLNAALDPLLHAAIGANAPITVVNLPEAPHSFDLFYDTEQTRQTLAQALAFLRGHLR